MTLTGRSDDAEAGPLAASFGLADADLVAMYRTLALARAVDERMWILNRAGRIPFVISGQGHEGAQVGLAWPLRRGQDWIAPFYRSIATCLAFGMTARDLMLAQYAKASDPGSGGRQMPGHYGSPERHLVSVSSPVATQILHAVGIALAAKIRHLDEVAVAIMGEGSSNQGDVHEALNFAAIHRLPVRADRREQRVRDQRPGREGAVRQGRRDAGLGVRDAGRRRRWNRRAGVLRGGPRRAGTGPERGRPDADRGQGDAPDGAQLGRPADEVPLRGRPRRGTRPRSAADLPGPAAGGRACSPPGSRRRWRPRSSRWSRTRRTSPRPRRTRTRSRRWTACMRMPPRASRRRPGIRSRVASKPPRAGADGDSDVHHAIRDAMADEMRRDASVIVLGEDVGKKGGRVPRDRRPVGGVRRRPGDRHAADGVDDRRRIDRRRAQRTAARRRDPVRGLHPSRRSTRSCPRRPGCGIGPGTGSRCRW